MTEDDDELLKRLAHKYIWWEKPEQAMRFPKRIMAQVMNIGDYSDVQRLVHQVGDDTLREVLMQAKPGQFNERSWNYWHYRLGWSASDPIPALPVRTFT